jgi:asparagine synthase (glutamine-hydrolysing)
MCGIYGKFLFNEYLDIESSCNALSQLTHRGPDGYGYEVGSIANNDYYINHNGKYVVGSEILESDYFLGHRRLSIVDLNDNAFQPMETKDKRYSIIFNGEIFNYIELRKELTELGCQFTTDHSDTEVLLNAYATWKEGCFKKLRGMFAFAIFDRQNSSLILARDRIGQKTLYYDLSDSGFSFSSELPPLLNKNSPRKLSKEAINNYMLLGYVPHPYSIFEGINKLPPASYALIDLNSKKIDIEEYWDIDGVIDNGKTDEEYLNLVNEALSESVELRLRADVSIGAFISGGTDSTLIIKKMKEVGKDKYDVYGADFPDTDRSEKKYIVEASDTYSQNLHLSSIDTSHIKNTDSIISIFDEPFDGASSIAVHELFKTAAKSHKVILTGDGGDELFAGYLRYQDFKQRYKRIRLLKNMILPSLFAKLAIKMGIKNRKMSKIYSVLKGDLLTTYAHINTELDLTNTIKPAFRVDDIFNLEPFSSTRIKICRKKLPLIKSLQYW